MPAWSYHVTVMDVSEAVIDAKPPIMPDGTLDDDTLNLSEPFGMAFSLVGL